MSTISLKSFKAFIGMDWADAKHDICLQVRGSEEQESACIEHRVDAIEAWARGLHERVGGPIAIALEQSRGPIVYALLKYDFLVLFPISPVMLAKYRKTFHPSGAKDDPSDAALILDLLVRHPERIKPICPMSEPIRKLLYLVEYRRKLVSDKVRYSNRLTTALKHYYPQVLEWMTTHDSRLFCDFLDRWPTLLSAKRARRSSLEKFFRDHRSRRADLMEARVAAIKSAQPLTLDPAVIDAYSLQVQVLVGQLRVTLEAIERYDEEIAHLAAQHPDYQLFDGLPGAGAALAPRLLAAFGDQRDRFASAEDVQMFVGVAPVTERSGKQCWVHWRTQCPTFLRQTFVEWARCSISQSYWAGAYYRQQRERGRSNQAALRALAFKWIRILYRCWRSRTPYDESAYLNALRQRGSPLLTYLGAAANPPKPM